MVKMIKEKLESIKKLSAPHVSDLNTLNKILGDIVTELNDWKETGSINECELKLLNDLKSIVQAINTILHAAKSPKANHVTQVVFNKIKSDAIQALNDYLNCIAN
jgi:hypothetical protein